MSFFIASHGNLDEAYDCLSSQLQVNPFRSHPLCHGYCALYQYLLHKKKISEVLMDSSVNVYICTCTMDMYTNQSKAGQMEALKADS